MPLACQDPAALLLEPIGYQRFAQFTQLFWVWFWRHGRVRNGNIIQIGLEPLGDRADIIQE